MDLKILTKSWEIYYEILNSKKSLIEAYDARNKYLIGYGISLTLLKTSFPDLWELAHQEACLIKSKDSY